MVVVTALVLFGDNTEEDEPCGSRGALHVLLGGGAAGTPPPWRRRMTPAPPALLSRSSVALAEPEADLLRHGQLEGEVWSRRYEVMYLTEPLDNVSNIQKG